METGTTCHVCVRAHVRVCVACTSVIPPLVHEHCVAVRMQSVSLPRLGPLQLTDVLLSSPLPKTHTHTRKMH